MLMKFLININIVLLLIGIIGLFLMVVNSNFIVFVTAAIVAIIVIDISAILGYIVYKVLQLLLPN